MKKLAYVLLALSLLTSCAHKQHSCGSCGDKSAACAGCKAEAGSNQESCGCKK